MADAWEKAVDTAWATAGDRAESEVAVEVRALAAQLPSGHPSRLYELASVHDFLGEELQAVRLYEESIAAGLSGRRRANAVIQLASSLRNVGEAEAGLALLEADLGVDDDLNDVRSAFVALMLIDLGRCRQAAAMLLLALEPHLPEYHRSVQHYAQDLFGTGHD